MKENKWFVECKCYNSNIEKKNCIFTGQNYSDISSGYNRFLFAGTFEEYNDWSSKFFDNDKFKVIDTGEHIENERELVFTPYEYKEKSKADQEELSKILLDAKERELKLGIKPVFYKPLITKAKLK